MYLMYLYDVIVCIELLLRRFVFNPTNNFRLVDLFKRGFRKIKSSEAIKSFKVDNYVYRGRSQIGNVKPPL